MLRVLSIAPLLVLLPARATDPPAKLFDAPNLVAWCIVPFDAKKRGPEERVAMLKQLGFTKYAYDWRAEHLPTFDREVGRLKEHNIELTAVWFPANLGADARALLAVVAKHKVTPQLWVTMGDPGGKDQAEKVANAAKVIRPIAEEAAKLGCKVALYNHGGWFGEPANEVAVVEHLKLPNVGIVYNLHHGHDHLARFPEHLAAMRPHLLALNLNGMVPDGEKLGKKILPLGVGTLDPGCARHRRERLRGSGRHPRPHPGRRRGAAARTTSTAWRAAARSSPARPRGRGRRTARTRGGRKVYPARTTRVPDARRGPSYTPAAGLRGSGRVTLPGRGAGAPRAGNGATS